ncbi:lipase family alpha/beta hydrolase [Yinghuangia soli]|uniref:Lipase family protein n=1 Tax=Yinghuangia soli TaxID=2908204 RepID=A0AA41Q972_9ACTN|nr:lipase family protein [Yinghuangia soli]MCF2533546.1 lipase family protein [Yinghuangia soli]
MAKLRTFLALLLLSVVASTGLTASAGAAAPPSSGWNDWSCRPSAAHPEPVVLVHGLGANGWDNFLTLAPTLKSEGYCVYSETYGRTVLGGLAGGLAPMTESAAELAAFVDRVQAATGADKVDIVGHSEGTTVPAYYMKYLGGAAEVDDFVGFGSNFRGTSLNGLATLAAALGLQDLLTGVGCGACTDYLPGSAFLAKLNDGPVAVPGPTYTSIVTRYDTVVTPYTSGLLAPAANVTNIVLQDKCGWDFAGHLGLAIDPNVAQLVLNRLDPAGSEPFRCRFFSTVGI